MDELDSILFEMEIFRDDDDGIGVIISSQHLDTKEYGSLNNMMKRIKQIALEFREEKITSAQE